MGYTHPESVTRFRRKGDGGLRHGFRSISGVPLNGTRSDLQAGFMEYRETSRKGKTRTWTWVTDMKITRRNAMKLMQAARARCRTGNGTSSAPTSQGCACGTGFGHGNRNLPSVTAALTFMAFTIDQTQQPLRALYRQAMRSAERPPCFRKKLRALFLTHLVGEWQDLYRRSFTARVAPLKPADTSWATGPQRPERNPSERQQRNSAETSGARRSRRAKCCPCACGAGSPGRWRCEHGAGKTQS